MTNLTLRTELGLAIVFIVSASAAFLATVQYPVGWTMLVLSSAAIAIFGYFIMNALRALHSLWRWSA